MENQVKKSFLGTGWAFPPEFNEHSLSVEMVSNEKDIHESLVILMSTTPGERPLNPGYGCDLQSLVFEKISESLFSSIRSMVSHAIFSFEPRVQVNEVLVQVVSYENGHIQIVVDYTIIQTNSRMNLVFPYYILEGTNINI